jgi:ferritin heavy chain
MQVALQLEKTVNQSLLDLHKVAGSHDDAQVGTIFSGVSILIS